MIDSESVCVRYSSLRMGIRDTLQPPTCYCITQVLRELIVLDIAIVNFQSPLHYQIIPGRTLNVTER